MKCGCTPVGFGASNGAALAGTISCYVPGVGYQAMPDGYAPSAGQTCYISDGEGTLYPYLPGQPPWNQLPVLNIPVSAVSNLFRNFTEGASQAWRQGSLAGNGMDAQSVGITLNNMALKVAPSVQFWEFTGPAQYAPSIVSGVKGLAWALSKGWLVITKQGAVLLQTNDQQSGVIPPSFWEMYGKPIAIMATIVGGAALAAGATAGAGAGGAGGASASGLAATPLPSVGSVVPAAPISIGGFAPVSSAGLTALGGVGTVGAAGTGAGVLGTLSGIAGAGGTVLKTAGALQQLSALGKTPGGPAPMQPASATPGQKPPSSALWLALAAAGAGALLLFAS